MLSDDLQLPYRIGKELLAVQFEIGTGNLGKVLIERAVSLYSEAIQIHINNSQTAERPEDRDRSIRGYKYYQMKLKKLLHQPEINQCLSGKKVSQNRSQNLLHRELNNQIKAEPEDAKKILRQFYENNLRQKRNIRKTLQQQNKAVEMRVQQRGRVKSMTSKRSETLTVDTNPSEQEI